MDDKIVKNISCDNCGYYNKAEKFPSIYSSQGREILKEHNLDLNKPSDLGYVQSLYAGAICPCGNFSNLDFYPDGLDKIVLEENN